MFLKEQAFFPAAVDFHEPRHCDNTTCMLGAMNKSVSTSRFRKVFSTEDGSGVAIVPREVTQTPRQEESEASA